MVTFVTHRKKSLFLQKISVMTKELQQFPLFSQCSEEMLAESSLTYRPKGLWSGLRKGDMFEILVPVSSGCNGTNFTSVVSMFCLSEF